MCKNIFFIFWVCVFVANANAQEIRLVCGIRPTKVEYYVDGLQMDSVDFFKLKLNKKEITRFKTVTIPKKIFPNKIGYPIKLKKDYYTWWLMICISTNMSVSLNSTVLSTKSEKEDVLSRIKKEDVISIEKLTKEQAVPIYGKKGRRGMLIIETK
ncbi:MAG: hypothetical protein E7076_06405 [Bacteroidales bacterium]|nr:hypothetical protein [Bacteroidales bacterium]